MTFPQYLLDISTGFSDLANQLMVFSMRKWYKCSLKVHDLTQRPENWELRSAEEFRLPFFAQVSKHDEDPMLNQKRLWWALWRKRSARAVIQSSPAAQSWPTLCNPMNRSTPGLLVHHQPPQFTQTHIHRVHDAIQPSHPLSSPSPPAPNPSASESFPMSQLFAWGGQSTEVPIPKKGNAKECSNYHTIALISHAS